MMPQPRSSDTSLLALDIGLRIPSFIRSITFIVGSGCGLTTIALAMCGINVITIDKNTVVPLLTENIRNYEICSKHWVHVDAHKAPTASIEVAELDWYGSDAVNKLEQILHGRYPDFIICSDCVYQSSSVVPLYNLIKEVCIFLVLMNLTYILPDFKYEY
jgi:hypothetical protein